MPSIFNDSPGGGKTLFNDAPADTLDSFGDPLGGMGGQTLFPSNNSIFGASEFMAEPAIQQVGPIEAGWNKSQEMMWVGLDSVAEAMGVETPEWLEERIQENAEIANSATLEDFGDKLLFGAGQVGPAAIAAIGSGLLAPYIGLTSALGTMVGGGLASTGMTLGDLKAKELELDENHKSEFSDIAYGTMMAIPDAFLLGKAKHIMAPIKELMKDSVIQNLKNAKGLRGTLANFAGDTAKIGTLEGLQDAGTSLGANLFTGTDIDKSRVEAIANSAFEEALIGGVLGMPVSGLNIYTNNLVEKQAEFEAEKADKILDYQKKAREFKRIHKINPTDLRHVDGVFNEDALTHVPTPGGSQQAGFFSHAFNMLTGNITDTIKGRNPDNKALHLITRQFNLRPQERKPGDKTVNDQAHVWTAEVAWKEGRDYFDANPDEQQAAWDRKAEGNADFNNSVDVALNNMLHGDRMHQIVVEASRGEIDVTEDLWADPTYLPIADTMDWESVATNEEAALNDLREMMKAQDYEESIIEQTLVLVRNQVKDWKVHGNSMHTGVTPDAKYEQGLIAALEDKYDLEELSDKENAEQKMKGIINAIRKKDSMYKRESPLTLDRMLKNAPQAWLEKHKDSNKKPAEVLATHIKKNMEHAALIDRFGTNLETFHELVARAIVEGFQNGRPLQKKDIEGLYDALRTQQRIHLKPVNQDWRRRQQMAKTILNTNLLGLSALVSIPESLSIPLNSDLRSAIKGLAQTMTFKDRKRFKDLSPEQQADVLVAAQDLNLNLSTAVQHVANRTNQDTVNMPKWEQTFIRYFTGLPYMQHFLSTWAGKAMDAHYRTLIGETMGSDIAARNRAIKKLSEAGIDIEEGQRWREKAFDQNDPWYLENYLPNLLTSVRDTIVDPDPVDKPAWQNNEHLMLISHLKGFMTAFTNRVMRGLKDRLVMEGPAQNRELIRRVMPYTAMYLLAQTGIGALREILKGGEVDDEKTFGQRVWNSFGYLGSAAYFVDMANAMQWRSAPLASAAGPAASISMQLGGSMVESMVNMDPEPVLKTIGQRAIPNMAGKDAVVDLWNTAWGIE